MMETYNIIQYTNTHEMSSVQNPKCHLVTLLYGFFRTGFPPFAPAVPTWQWVSSPQLNIGYRVIVQLLRCYKWGELSHFRFWGFPTKHRDSCYEYHVWQASGEELLSFKLEDGVLLQEPAHGCYGLEFVSPSHHGQPPNPQDIMMFPII